MTMNVLLYEKISMNYIVKTRPVMVVENLSQVLYGTYESYDVSGGDWCV